MRTRRRDSEFTRVALTPQGSVLRTRGDEPTDTQRDERVRNRRREAGGGASPAHTWIVLQRVT